ncbi:MAG: helix-turn-helix transcriptional regulator [Planctomycetes bacterium]|nr:helix-turn-helix transcriptional regulator [Planctomycetota bacterium]
MNTRNIAESRTRKLMYYRIRKGLTLMDVSKKTGLSTATLHRIERGLMEPSARSRIKIMDGLKLTSSEVDELCRVDLEVSAGRSKFMAASTDAR